MLKRLRLKHCSVRVPPAVSYIARRMNQAGTVVAVCGQSAGRGQEQLAFFFFFNNRTPCTRHCDGKERQKRDERI